MAETKNSNMYIKSGSNFSPAKDVEVSDRLIPGLYKLKQNPNTGELYFQKTKHNCDNIVDIPSKEYKQVVDEMDLFLEGSTKVKFKEHGFLYKRSALLHGAAGGGKTSIVNRVASKVIQGGGIVLFNPDIRLIEDAFAILNDVQPETMTLVIFEEVNETLARFEEELLSILDGEVQKDNVMYLATTNFLEEIPARICRPGRFSSIIEVKFPDIKARTVYLQTKLKDADKIDSIATATDGFSIDEVKETVLATECLNQTLKNVVERIKFTKGLAKDLPESTTRGNKKKQRESRQAEMDYISSAVMSLSNRRN